MRQSTNQRVAVFWATFGALAVLWALRGFSLLAFLPSGVIGLLLIVVIGLGIYNVLHYTRY